MFVIIWTIAIASVLLIVALDGITAFSLLWVVAMGVVAYICTQLWAEYWPRLRHRWTR